MRRSLQGWANRSAPSRDAFHITTNRRRQPFPRPTNSLRRLDRRLAQLLAEHGQGGALGKPVWVLLPFCPDWRWLTERGDSPWYPTARLFRQSRIGDWDSVIVRVAGELAQAARATA